MTYIVKVPNGILCMCETLFKCPKCTCPHDGEKYIERINKNKSGITYVKCKGCGAKIGLTFDIRGDVRVWLKEDEKTSETILKQLQ
jgi:hypothetical protein